MTVALSGTDVTPGHLLIAENWYPDWHAEVDGRPGTVRRANHSLLSVDLPAGAKGVRLWFDSPAYARGKVLSLISLIAALGLTLVPSLRARFASIRSIDHMPCFGECQVRPWFILKRID